MVFAILKGILGAGVSVDTVLTSKHVTPGGILQGDVTFSGGEVDHKVEGINLELTALVEQDDRAPERTSRFDFHTAQVSGPFQLTKGAEHKVSFEVPIPWETPLSTLEGRPLPGMTLGVSTVLALDKAFDKGDLDPLSIEPLPAQVAALNAMNELGFVFQMADLEEGTIPGSHMPFYQEIEYWPGGEFKDSFTEVELTFVSDRETTDIILQANDPGTILSAGHDTYQRISVDNAEPGDLVELIRIQLQQLAQRIR